MRRARCAECSKAYWKGRDAVANRANAKDWYEKNKAKSRLKVRTRKVRIFIVDELKPGEWEAMVEACGNKCIVPGCGQGPVTQDHVIPISKKGRHHISNMQPLCRSHNSSKGSKIVDYRGLASAPLAVGNVR